MARIDALQSPRRLMPLADPIWAAHDRAVWLRWFLWLALATSSVVVIEPAPYDALTIGLLVTAFALGLKVPRAFAASILFLTVFLVGNLAGALAAGLTFPLARALAIRIYLVLTWLLFATLISREPAVMLKTVWSGYTCAALFAVCWGIAQYYGWFPGVSGGPALRATGPFKDANVFGPFLVPVILLFALRSLKARSLLSMLVNLGGVLLLLLGIFLAFSRGAWLNLLAALGLLGIFLLKDLRSVREQTKYALIALALVVLAIAALTWVVEYTAAGRMFVQRASLVQAYDVSDTGRFATQLKAILAIGTNPIGVGPGTSAAVLGLQPHNLYLHVTVEGGWLGGIGLSAFLLLSVWLGFRSLASIDPKLRPDLQIVLACVVGVLLQSLFIDSTHWRHLFLLLGMLSALTVTSKHGGQRHAELDHVRRI